MHGMDYAEWYLEETHACRYCGISKVCILDYPNIAITLLIINQTLSNIISLF